MATGELIPSSQITLNPEERAKAEREVIKLNQLIMLDGDEEDTKTPNPNDAINVETLECAVPCLIMVSTQEIEKELLWRSMSIDLAVPILTTTTTGIKLSSKPISSGFRAQKATTSVKEKVEKVELYSNYIMSPLKRDYKTFLHRT